MGNLATSYVNATTLAARKIQVPNADFDGGVNKSGSNSAGIGICTGIIDPTLDNWTVLDQDSAARDPQDSQHIGGNGLDAGDASVSPINAVQGADVNDTLSFIVALANAADGVGMGAANADPINRTGEAVVIGDRVWGTNTVA